jgi:hypothetical protein
MAPVGAIRETPELRVAGLSLAPGSRRASLELLYLNGEI